MIHGILYRHTIRVRSVEVDMMEDVRFARDICTELVRDCAQERYVGGSSQNP